MDLICTINHHHHELINKASKVINIFSGKKAWNHLTLKKLWCWRINLYLTTSIIFLKIGLDLNTPIILQLPCAFIRLNLDGKLPQKFFNVRPIWMVITGLWEGEIFEKIRKKTFEVSKFSSPYCSGILTLKYSECLLHTFTPKSHWTPRLLRLAKSSLLIFAINLYLLFFFWEHKLLKQLYQLLLKY